MKPSAIILDLLRTYSHRGTTVKNIMATGAMFDFSENLMRVNLSRLVAKGTVENFKRGHYRLTNRTDPVNDFVEAWRLGESRVRPWDDTSWLLVHTSTQSNWALDAMGFRPISAGLWARPSNLADDPGRVEHRLSALGMEPGAVMIRDAGLAEPWPTRWREQFDIPALLARYGECRDRLDHSLAHLDDLHHEDALKESFRLGGAAVQMLAKDPLIPEQWIDTGPRRELWLLMLTYDQKGREIWGRRGKDRPEIMPTPQQIAIA